MDIKSITQKRIGKVPVVYIAAAVVLVLAVVAYRMKGAPSADAVDPGTSDTTGDLTSSDGASDAGIAAGDVYPQMPTGTVVAQSPTGPVNESGNASIETNQEWLSTAALWLAKEKGVSPGTAQAALTKYLDGDQLTYDEGQWRDAAVRQFGFPPDLTPTPVTGGKPVPPTPPKKDAPATRQGPLPRTHIVRGSNDNSLTELAKLYYSDHGGATQEIGDMIQAANPQLPNRGSGPFKPGTGVHLPVYHPAKYFIATKTVNTLADIAKRNGLSQEQLRRLNDGAVNVAFPARPGTRVRVA